MISELKIRNFKSLESVDLKLGHFNLLVGANASGKSNFLDALRFLQGLGNGLTIDEILNGKPPSSTSLKWDGIRGGAEFVSYRTKRGLTTSTIELEVILKSARDQNLKYEMEFNPSERMFVSERLTDGTEILHEMTREKHKQQSYENLAIPYVSSSIGNLFANLHFYDSLRANANAQHNSLEKIPDGESRKLKELCWEVLDFFRDMQFLDPLPATLRSYSSKVLRLGENGEGFAALIHEIESNGSKPALLEWLKELRPDEVDDIYALEGLNNDFMVAIKEGNKEFRGPVLSEGTLRFIALAAAFFQPSMPKVLVIEEIERGLHPSRLRLLLELMRSQSRRTGTQVFATTHSPTLLAWLTEEDRKTTFVCTRDAESGATRMRSLAEVPRLEELVRERHSLDQLFEQGWIESVLHES